MKIQNVKGCNDYLPEEQKIRNYINDVLKETFNDLVKEIYKLTDQGKRELGLRYDLTVPFAKFIALNKNKVTFPFKRYEIAKAFRDGPVKLGRDREFTQCDVDVVGLSGQMIEAECLNLYVNAFDKLGIEVEIQYNSRNLMRGLILESGIDEEKVSSVITIIDKKDKLSRDEFRDSLMNLDLDAKQVEFLLHCFTLSLDELNRCYFNTDSEILKKGLLELNELNRYIEGLGIESYCRFTSTLARGQDYYTGNVFEVYEKTRKLNSSIGGGGRYDQMITNYIHDGEVYPAVGISFGLSSIYELLKEREDLVRIRKADIYLIPMDTELFSLKIANLLRKKGMHVLIEMNKKRIKKCFEWANKNEIPFVSVIGDEELQQKRLVVKNMETGESKFYSFEEIDQLVEMIK